MSGRSLTDLEVLRLDPRRDLERLREALEERLRAGQDLSALLRAVADRDPQALAELAVGPRALSGPALTRAVLPLASTLEQVIPARALYRRLAELSGSLGAEVLAEAIRRHPGADWLMDLSRRVEGEAAGFTHLCGLASDPAFADACDRYARAGYHRGLVQVAVSLGRIEPLGALARLGDADAVAHTVAGLIESQLPVIPCLAATWGPDLVPVLLRVIQHLPDLAALHAFRQQTLDLPRVQRALDPLIKG